MMASIVGMMWQWNQATGLEEAIRQAVLHYERTRGYSPLVCYVNERVLVEAGNGSIQTVEEVLVRPLKGIAPFHLWVTREEVAPHNSKDIQEEMPS